MTERLFRFSQSKFPALRLWRAPSWPVGEASLGGRAAEWRSGQPGHPTSYALLGVHDGPDTAAHAHVGEAFNEALIGRADDVLFGLPAEYRGAVDDVLAAHRDLSPSLAALGRTGSSVVAFRAMAIFLRDLTDELWSSNDDALWQARRLVLDAAQFDGGPSQRSGRFPASSMSTVPLRFPRASRWASTTARSNRPWWAQTSTVGPFVWVPERRSIELHGWRSAILGTS
ncbi:MAG: hypothetical protein GY720_21060 [bacterium]|nr:hypothetical protein [bacterium]